MTRVFTRLINRPFVASLSRGERGLLAAFGDLYRIKGINLTEWDPRRSS